MRKDWILFLLVLLIIVAGKVVHLLFPDPYFTLPLFVLLVCLSLSYFIIRSIIRERALAKREKSLRKVIRIRYEDFKRKHGSMLEESHAYLDENDKAAVRKVLHVFIFVISPVSLILFSLLLIFIWEGTVLSYIFLVFILAIAGCSIYGYFRYTDILAGNEKLTIKGVITAKTIIKNGEKQEYDFLLSEKTTISVKKSQYNSFTLGDIVKVEILSRENNLDLKKTVSLIGRIKME